MMGVIVSEVRKSGTDVSRQLPKVEKHQRDERLSQGRLQVTSAEPEGLLSRRK